MDEIVFRLGDRVRVNKKYPYGDSHGRAGTVEGLPDTTGRNPLRYSICVKFDDHRDGFADEVQWHKSYFDLIP